MTTTDERVARVRELAAEALALDPSGSPYTSSVLSCITHGMDPCLTRFADPAQLDELDPEFWLRAAARWVVKAFDYHEGCFGARFQQVRDELAWALPIHLEVTHG